MENVRGFSVERVNGMIWLSFFDYTGRGEVYPLSDENVRRIIRELEQFLGPNLTP